MGLVEVECCCSGDNGGVGEFGCWHVSELELLGLGLEAAPAFRSSSEHRASQPKRVAARRPSRAAHKVSRRTDAIGLPADRASSLALFLSPSLVASLTAIPRFYPISCRSGSCSSFERDHVLFLALKTSKQRFSCHLRVPRACLVKTAREDCVTTPLELTLTPKHTESTTTTKDSTKSRSRRRWPLKNPKTSHGIAATGVRLRRGRGRHRPSAWLPTRPVEATHRMRSLAGHRHAMHHLHKTTMMVIALHRGSSSVLVRGLL